MTNLKVKTLITELREFYTLDELSSLCEVSTQTLSDLEKSKVCSNKNTEDKIRAFFSNHAYNHSQELTVPEMMKIESKFLVESPEDWVEIEEYVVKSEKPCYKITAGINSVECSEKHLIQKFDNSWVFAKDLNIGDVLLTKDGGVELTKIETLETQTVYDIQVGSDEHRYWSGGISSHNTFKTGFILKILANAQKKGMHVVIYDTEGAIDDKSAAAMGLDTSKVRYCKTQTAENTRNSVYKLLNKIKENKWDGKFIIAIDSLANLQSEMEVNRMEKENTSADMGTFAKSIKSLLKTCTVLSNLTNTPILVTNHVYDDPSQMYPTLEKNIAGGKAAVYLPSVTVQLARKPMKDDGGKTVDDTKSASQKSFSGVVIRALTVKNRFVKQYLEGEMYLSFATGLDKYYGIVDIMKGLGVVVLNGATYSDWKGEKLGFFKQWRKKSEVWDYLLPELESRIKSEWAYGNKLDSEVPDEVDDSEEESED
jgi:RecA/RadA recombinase